MPMELCQGKFGSLVASFENVESGGRFGYSRSSTYESFASRCYRSGKNCRGVCVPGCGIATVGADVGVGVDGARNGVLRRKYVRSARTWKEQVRREEPFDKERDGVRALAWRWDDGLQYVLLPRARHIAGE